MQAKLHLQPVETIFISRNFSSLILRQSSVSCKLSARIATDNQNDQGFLCIQRFVLVTAKTIPSAWHQDQQGGVAVYFER